MTSDPRLENYLTSLEHVLKPFPVSDRAEIVTEIKSHVVSALDRDPQTRLDTVLSALGEPETVANRYLIERGLKLTKPPISPMVKWIVIGFLCTFAMVLIFVGVMVFQFTPLLQVDEGKDKVSLLGGMIKVDGKKGTVQITDRAGGQWSLSTKMLEGAAPVNKDQAIDLKFINGTFELQSTTERQLSWDCTAQSSEDREPTLASDKAKVTLDLRDLQGVQCDLRVPVGTHLTIQGTNGQLSFEEPRFHINASLANGLVTLEPDHASDYRYDLKVNVGKIDTFPSSEKAGAFSVKVHLVNGKISNEREE